MTHTDDALRKQQELYASSSEHVRGRGMSEAQAQGYYARYREFVALDAAPGGTILDVGCGNGWSSFVLASAGFQATGVDLNPQAFEPPPHPRMTLRQGSATQLPFPDESFDAVASNQMLEHVDAPEAALAEMLRVAKPGGTVSIVSPNLVSVLSPVVGVTYHVWKNRPLRTIFFRAPGMPRHPGGNTLPEAAGQLFKRVWITAGKLLSPRPTFTMREPDLQPPFHADNDACYLCNPIDLIRYFRTRNCRILRKSAPNRPPLTWLLARGTFVTVRKPSAPHSG